MRILFKTVVYFCNISYSIVSIFIASSYVGGCSSIQYLGGESIIPSSRTDSFFLASKIQYFKILSVIITIVIEINKNIKVEEVTELLIVTYDLDEHIDPCLSYQTNTQSGNKKIG